MTEPFFLNELLLVFLLSIIIGISFGIPSTILALKLGIVDVPNSAPHKKHTRSTPLAGGILISFTLLVIAIVFNRLLNFDILVTLLGTLIIVLFGVWDDLQGLSAVPKLLGQIVASTLLISLGIQVRFMTNFALQGYLPLAFAETLNILITYFWLIGITNDLNMIDSMDGIAAGIGVIASLFFMGATILANQFTLAIWSAVLLSINISLYFWNGIKSRFFLGDSGAQAIGFLLATIGILYNPLEKNPESSWIVPIMLLGIPIFDTSLVVLSRFKRKQPIGSGRRDHTYHRLIALGFTPKNAVILTHIIALGISCLAYFTLSFTPFLALVVFVTTVVCGIFILLWLERKPTLDE